MRSLWTPLVVLTAAFATGGPAVVALPVRAAVAAQGDCTVSCSAPLKDNDANQWYVVVTNGCDSTAHVDVRNNGTTYGIECPPNADSPKQYIGRTLGDDFKVLKIRLVK